VRRSCSSIGHPDLKRPRRSGAASTAGCIVVGHGAAANRTLGRSRRADREATQSKNHAQKPYPRPSEPFALDARGFGAIIEKNHAALAWRTMTDSEEQLQAFGEFVRAQRRLAQVSQRNLARMSGVSDSYLSQIERGNYRPSPQVVKALATAFGLEPKQLYTMLGFMDEEESTGPPSVEQAIQLDTRLDAAQKEALIGIYRSLVGKG
jgi:transcriptional regulator with XRE-family HTH domain